MEVGLVWEKDETIKHLKFAKIAKEKFLNGVGPEFSKEPLTGPLFEKKHEIDTLVSISIRGHVYHLTLQKRLCSVPLFFLRFSFLFYIMTVVSERVNIKTGCSLNSTFSQMYFYHGEH